MKKLFFPPFIICFGFLILNAQTTDKFIRIVGTSSHTFIANGIKAEILISEIPPNERKNTEGTSYQTAYTRFTDVLKTIDISENDLKPSMSNFRAASSNSKNFTLTLNNPDKIQTFLSAELPEGAKITSLLYTYTSDVSNIEQQLITQAIADAERKAKNICREIGKTPGKILNIEDASADCCENIKDSQESSTSKTYHVYVTFELKD